MNARTLIVITGALLAALALTTLTLGALAPAALAEPAAPADAHVIQLTKGENTLYVRKDSAGFFSAAVGNRTFATVSGGYATLKAGSNVKAKLFAKASCPKNKSYCMIKVFVNDGPGQLVYGNLYRIFGYENLAVRQVFEIGADLKVTLPRAITSTPPETKANT